MLIIKEINDKPRWRIPAAIHRNRLSRQLVSYRRRAKHRCGLTIVLTALHLFVPSAISNAKADTADPQDVRGGLNADRPSFAESPGTVPPGQFQLEGGVKYVEIDSDNEELTVGQLNFRFGWLEALEFRVFWDGYEDFSPGDTDFADPNLQLKWRFTPDRALGLRAALLGSLSVPLGDSDAVEPKISFIGDYGRSSGFQPYGTFDFKYPEENGERLYVIEPSIGVGYPLGKIELFAAYFGIFKEGKAPLHSIDGGITYQINERLQVDLEFGVGLNDDADTFGVSSGFVHRW